MPTVRQIKGYKPNETNPQLTAAETFTGEDENNKTRNVRTKITLWRVRVMFIPPRLS